MKKYFISYTNIIMRNILLIFFLLFATTVIHAQTDTRKFIKTASLCPIDISILSTQDLLRQKTLDTTIHLIKLTDLTKITNETGAIIKQNDTSFIKKIDTIYKFSVLSKPGMVFTIERTIGSFTVIKFWSFRQSKKTKSISQYKHYSRDTNIGNYIPPVISEIKKNTVIPNIQQNSTSSYDTINVDPTLDFYLVKTDELMSSSLEFVGKKDTWSLGLMYLPVKVRPFATRSGAFDFTSEFSLGTTFSWTFYHNNISDRTISLIIYTGVSSIKVDSATSGSNNILYSTNPSIVAFSPAIGLTMIRNGIQLGLAIGIDFPANQLQKTWIYRNMPWISLSAGVNIFNLNQGSSNRAAHNNKSD